MNNLRPLLWLFPALAIQLVSFGAAIIFTVYHFPFDVWDAATKLANNERIGEE
jgi:hypothetical protein